MVDALRHIDYLLFYWVNTATANPVFDFLCPLLRHKLTWLPLYAWLAWVFYKKYGQGVLWLAVGAGLTILLADQISSSLIKPLVHRLRPCNNPVMKARLVIEHCGAGYSFVSSHAANHFGLAAFISGFVEHARYKALLFLWAASVAFAQVYVGVHFPADVAAGALLGMLTGCVAFWLVRRKVSLNGGKT